jgi:hypothetical protein
VRAFLAGEDRGSTIFGFLLAEAATTDAGVTEVVPPSNLFETADEARGARYWVGRSYWYGACGNRRSVVRLIADPSLFFVDLTTRLGSWPVEVLARGAASGTPPRSSRVRTLGVRPP